MITDSYCNTNKDHITSFCVKIAEYDTSFFVSSKNTTGVSQNSDEICKNICELLERFGPEEFVSIVTDNASTMQSAKRMVKQKYSHILTVGCAFHGINLIIKDFMDDITNKQAYSEIESVVKFFKMKEVAKKWLSDKKNEGNIGRSLSFPVVTRWTSSLEAIENLKIYKNVMININDEEMKSLRNIAPKSSSNSVLTIIKNEDFWTRVDRIWKAINPNRQ